MSKKSLPLSSLYMRLTDFYGLVPRLLTPGFALPPLQLFIEVTYKCNLRCSFCQFIVTRDHIPVCTPASAAEELSTDDLNRVLKEVPKRTLISFSGGEPLLKHNFMHLLHSVSRRNKTHIFTNGTRITGECAHLLVEAGARNFLDAGLVLVGISLEGMEDTHDTITGCRGAYRSTVAGIKALVAHKTREKKKYPLIELKTVISENNVGDLYDIFLVAKGCGVDVFNVMSLNLLPQANRLQPGNEVSYMNHPTAIRPIDPHLLRGQLIRIRNAAAESGIQLRTSPMAFSLEQIISYYSNGPRAGRYVCHYPWYGAAISAYGDVSICPYAIIGNVKDTPLGSLLNNKRARSFRRKLKEHGSFPGCWGCCMLIPSNRPGQTLNLDMTSTV